MKEKSKSIKDIARALNVSITTVSFVLNGKAEEKRISKEVTARIISYAKEVNYSPNRVAKSLRTGKSNILVFMVEDISNPFFAKLARIIEKLASERAYNVIFCSNENKDSKTAELIDLFNERKVDGYIIIPPPGALKKIQELQNNEIPVVLFDRYFATLETDMVVVNDEKSTYKATKQLIENGFKAIGLVSIEARQTQMKNRVEGYRKALSEVTFEESMLFLPFDVDQEKLLEARLAAYLSNNPQLDALVFSTNYLAIHGISMMKEKFPGKIEHLGIYTFDDDRFFRIHSPSISAISQPLEAIGKTLMDIMLMRLKEGPKKIKSVQVVLETELKPRESSQPLHLRQGSIKPEGRV